MIGNNDWLDYLDRQRYLAHSWGNWDKKNVKYVDKVPTKNGKYRYIYPEDKQSSNRNRNSNRSVPTYNGTEYERRQAQRQMETNRRESDRRAALDTTAKRNSDYRRQVEAERRQADQQTLSNQRNMNQQIEADKLRRGYEAQRRQAEQQMATNSRATDRHLYDVAQTARADSEKRDMERKTQIGRGQNEQAIAEDRKPKNLFDRMGNAIGSGLKSVGDAASGAWDKATGGDGRLDWEDVTSAAKSAGNQLGGAASAAGDWLGERGKEIGNAAGAAGDWLSDRAKEVTEAGRNLFGRSNNQASIPDLPHTLTEQVIPETRLFEDIQTERKPTDNAVREPKTNLFDQVGNAVTGAAGAAGDWFNTQAQNAAAAGRNLFDNAGKAVSGAVDSFNDLSKSMAEGAYNTGKNLFDTAGNAIGGVGDYIKSIPQQVSDASGLTAFNQIDNDALQKADAAKAEKNQMKRLYNNYHAMVENVPQMMDMARRLYKEANYYREIGNESVARQLDDQVRQLASQITLIQTYNNPSSDYTNAVRNYVRANNEALNSQNAQNAYESSPLGQVENALGNMGINKDDFRKWLATMGR